MKKFTTVTAAVLAGMVGFAGVAGALPVPYTRSMTYSDLMAKSYASSVSDSDNSDVKLAKLVTDGSDPKVRDAADFAADFDPSAIDQDVNDAIFKNIEGDEATCAEAGPLVIEKAEGDSMTFHLYVASKFKAAGKGSILISILNPDGTETNVVLECEISDQNILIFNTSKDLAQAIYDGTAYWAFFTSPDLLVASPLD